MLPGRLDTLFAFKAIVLSPLLSGSEKRVAGVLLDHFNRKTGQCDPSLDTIAALLSISRRTVIRAIDRLVRIGFFLKVRHGGKFHRNSYQPVWGRFRQFDADWIKLRRERSAFFTKPNLSPSTYEWSHFSGDREVTQTCTSNQFNETSGDATAKIDHSTSHNFKGLPSQESPPTNRNHLSAPLEVKPARSAEAARDAAERRWNEDLHARYAHCPYAYGIVVEAIDLEMTAEATEAEYREKGSGLAVIVRRLTLLPPKG